MDFNRKSCPTSKMRSGIIVIGWRRCSRTSMPCGEAPLDDPRSAASRPSAEWRRPEPGRLLIALAPRFVRP